MKTYLVGGAVRDMMMGIEPKDRDYVVVGSTPEEMIANGFKQVGADFPVFLDQDGTEYALARTERKTGKGYHGFVADFGLDVTLEDDLARRDLTINAMAFADGNLFDPYGGVEDIEIKTLRHVSPAFAEDPVRVLRIARFNARFGAEWTISPGTCILVDTMVKNGELNHLTRERVLAEFEKAIGERDTRMFFSALHHMGALNAVLPELTWSNWCDFCDGDESPKLKYAYLMSSIADAEAFELKYVVKTEWREYRKMYDVYYKGAAQVNESYGMVDMLYEMDAYRKVNLFRELIADLGLDDSDLSTVFEQTLKFGFNDLTESQRAELRGPAITDAIRQLRKQHEPA